MTTGKSEVRDLSFLTVLALQEADCFRRREETDARYLGSLAARLGELLGPDGRFRDPGAVAVYRKALKDAAGGEARDDAQVADGLREMLDLIGAMNDGNAAGAAERIAPAALRQTMAFLRSLHDQLLAQKRAEAARRATDRVLGRRE